MTFKRTFLGLGLWQPVHLAYKVSACVYQRLLIDLGKKRHAYIQYSMYAFSLSYSNMSTREQERKIHIINAKLNISKFYRSVAEWRSGSVLGP